MSPQAKPKTTSDTYFIMSGIFFIASTLVLIFLADGIITYYKGLLPRDQYIFIPIVSFFLVGLLAATTATYHRSKQP